MSATPAMHTRLDGWGVQQGTNLAAHAVCFWVGCLHWQLVLLCLAGRRQSWNAFLLLLIPCSCLQYRRLES